MLKTFAETFRMICGAYPVYARSPSPSQRPAPTTIASRSPFPLSLCSCSTSLTRCKYKRPQGAARPRGNGDISDARFMLYINPTLMVFSFFFNSSILQTGPNKFVENEKQNQDNTGRFGMKNLPKRLELFCRNVFAETSCSILKERSWHILFASQRWPVTKGLTVEPEGCTKKCFKKQVFVGRSPTLIPYSVYKFSYHFLIVKTSAIINVKYLISIR